MRTIDRFFWIHSQRLQVPSPLLRVRPRRQPRWTGRGGVLGTRGLLGSTSQVRFGIVRYFVFHDVIPVLTSYPTPVISSFLGRVMSLCVSRTLLHACGLGGDPKRMHDNHSGFHMSRLPHFLLLAPSGQTQWVFPAPS